MKDYEVNSDTLAIIAKDDKKSLVFEDNYSFEVDKSSYKIMEESCEYFGSSISGRQKGSKSLTGITHKVPIIIEETSNLIFFPTNSPRLESCSWISLNNIKDYYKNKKGSKILFNNGQELELDISYGILNNQILRSSRLQAKLNERKIIKNAKKTKKIG